MSINLNNKGNSQLLSDIIHRIDGFTAALEDYQKKKQKYAMGTKLECTSIVMLAEGSKAKAVATVTVNDEFVLKGIKVYDGANGLFVSMPSRKFGNKYSDVVFPITKQAREQLNSAVLGSYGKLLESGLDKLQTEKKVPPEKSASKITVSLHQTNNERTKAVGQVVIDDCIVISGVKVNHGTNTDGIEKDFVGMPSYQTQTGEYNEYAHPITKECYDKVHSAVLKAYETLQKTEYKGVKLSELGEKSAVSSKYGLNNKFAEKLMAELEKRGIPYSAKVAETTSLFVRSENKAAVNSLEKELSTAMKKSKAAEAPYVTVEPFSNVDFAKIGLEREKRYTIPEFNKALENADKLYTADEKNSFRVDSFTVTLHIGENNYDYRPMLGAEYGTLSAIMDDISLGNSSNLSITTQEKELVAEIERNAQKPKVNDMHDTPATAIDEVVPNTTDNLEKEPSAAMKNKTQQPKQEQKPAHSKSKSR